VNPDGTVRLVEGSPDIGGTRASVAQQLAEVLGIPVEDVHPTVGDTDSIGFTSTTGGSGVTFKTGWAAYEAAQDITRQMRERAARIWNCPVEEVAYQDGVLQHTQDAEKRLTFKQLAARQNPTGGPITGRAGVNPGGAGPCIATHIVDVEVDPETGKVTILRYTAVQDAGKAIHPSYVENQMQGGAVQGIGWALNEEYYYNEDGHMVNASFLDYRVLYLYAADNSLGPRIRRFSRLINRTKKPLREGAPAYGGRTYTNMSQLDAKTVAKYRPAA